MEIIKEFIKKLVAWVIEKILDIAWPWIKNNVWPWIRQHAKEASALLVLIVVLLGIWLLPLSSHEPTDAFSSSDQLSILSAEEKTATCIGDQLRSDNLALVYSAPGKDAVRRLFKENIGPLIKPKEEVAVYATNHDWALIRLHSTVLNASRFGWVEKRNLDLSSALGLKEVDPSQWPVYDLKQDSFATDAPEAAASSVVASLKKGTKVSAFAYLDASKAWIYCSFVVSEGGADQRAMGFIPAADLQTASP